MSGLFGGGDAPNYDGMNRAAEANAAISKEAFDWYRQEYENTRAQREATQARANEISDAQLQAMQQQNEITQDYWDYQKNTFRPLEEKMVEESTNYNTAGRRQEAAAEATADVEMALAGQQQALQRNVARMGGSVSSSQALALQSDAALAGAKMKAGAANAARKNIETVGYARMADAANLGRNLASNQATSASVALQQGNSSVANSSTANSTGMSGASLMGQGFSTALQGNQSAGNLYGQVANLQAQSNNSSGVLGALGGIAGQYAGSASGSAALTSLFGLSDEDKKKDTKTPADTGEMLEQVEKTPVMQDWQYDPAKGGPDMGGQKFDGPMSENVRATMGEAVAPGGKVIDLISMNGRLMGAVQELSKQVKEQGRKVARMEMAVAA